MPTARHPFARRFVLATAATALLAFSLVGHAHRAMAAAEMHTTIPKVATGLAWPALTPAQRTALEPLAAQWGQLDDNARQKWVKVASRFDALTPQERQRLQERMKQWAALQPSERGEARLRFQQTRQLPSDERQQKWAAYQSLSAEDRQDLTRQGQRRTRTVMLADNMVGPREAGQAFAAKRQTTAASAPGKSNVVPSVPTGLSGPNAQGAVPMVVAPTLVKASTGATTNLVTRQPAPPAHQASGSTKITASKDYVNPVTLLPRKGSQSAALASFPASAGATGGAP